LEPHIWTLIKGYVLPGEITLIAPGRFLQWLVRRRFWLPQRLDHAQGREQRAEHGLAVEGEIVGELRMEGRASPASDDSGNGSLDLLDELFELRHRVIDVDGDFRREDSRRTT